MPKFTFKRKYTKPTQLQIAILNDPLNFASVMEILLNMEKV